MATNFEYISSVGALPVNLGRQQYGPLDGSSVFKSIVDLKYYILASRNPIAVSSLSETSAIYENASDYWKKIATRYAYVGQNVTVVNDSGVNNYKIVNVPTLEEISVVMSNDISAEPNPKMFKKIADMESVDDITDALSNAISSKIYFDDYGTEKYGDLSVIKLGAEEYAQLLDLSATNKQAIYIISSDNKNAYGKKIINLADGSSLSDAVNLKQLTSTASTVSSDLKTTISSVSSELTSDISSVSSALSDAISAKIFFKEYDEEGKYGDLSVIKIGAEKYAELLDLTATNKQAIYIVSSDNQDAFGQKIINLADGSSLSDAVNLKQLTSAVSMVSVGLTGNVSELSSNLISTISSVSSVLSNDLSTKIFFKEYDEEGKYGDLSVIKLGAEEYAELLDLTATNKQAIYIVSSDNQDAFGQKIINLADGTSLSDAVNFKQLTSAASTVSSELTSNISSVSSILSDAISVKVQIHDYDNSVRYTDLSIIKMQKDTYDTARTGGLNQDALYMVSSDYIDAYGGQVKNVDDATQDYDAVNLKQLKKKIFIRNYDKSGNELTAFDDLSVLKMSIDEYKDLVESDEISALSNSLFVISSNNIDALMQRITNLADGVDDYDAVSMKQFVRVSSDTNTKIFFKEYDNPGEYNSLSIVKIGMDEYEDLLDPDSDVDVDEHTIYFISSDNKNVYGEKIVNLADGTDPTDAINKSQLTNCLSGYPNLSSVNWNSVSLSTIVDMVKFAFSQLGGGQVSY